MKTETVRIIPEQVIKQYEVHGFEITCDGCGKRVDEGDHGENYAHDLGIVLDAQECVSFRRFRDYCPACLDPIWKAINELIKADPDTEGEEGREW